MTKWHVVYVAIFDGDDVGKMPKIWCTKEKFQKLDDDTATKVERSRYTNNYTWDY